MKIGQTLAIFAASAFLTTAAAQAQTNMDGQPLVAGHSDMHPMTGRSAMMMHHHHHHPMMMHHHHHPMMHHHHMMHKHM